MSSREKILDQVRKSQPPPSPLPELNYVGGASSDILKEFITSVGNIGGTAMEVSDWKEIDSQVQERFSSTSRCISMIPQLESRYLKGNLEKDPRAFEDVSVAILAGHFCVAENGAVWITEENMGDRVLPFICEHLVLVVSASAVCGSMHDAYERIGLSGHNFGTFIAGPSKTADIEQSLVLGAHGPKTLTIFLLHT
jgi:L-lactate dehydrogenase complex protein LldG